MEVKNYKNFHFGLFSEKSNAYIFEKNTIAFFLVGGGERAFCLSMG